MIRAFQVDDARVRRRFPELAKLVRPLGGLMQSVYAITPEISGPQLSIATTPLGNLTMAFPHVKRGDGDDVRSEPLGGAGSDFDREIAWVRAVAEGAERYACLVFDESDLIVASANELGDAALSFARIPQLSAREYADPLCPMSKPDPGAPIRWVKGYSLIDQRLRYVPAVMAFLYFPATKHETFWNMISTGVATHTSLEAALVSAICEVIERDAIALTWLCRLPLPAIEVDSPAPPELAPGLEALKHSLVRHYMYDATTDLGVPTVYCVQTLENDAGVAQFVNCATDFNPISACAKTIRECAAARPVLREKPALGREPADFFDIHDGAVFLGNPAHRDAFQFLLGSAGRKRLGQMETPHLLTDADRLRWLVDRLRSLGMEAVAVDLTTDELRAAGLWTVRVVIPELVPMSPLHRARFLGHPRLYSYPQRAGFGPRSENDINPLPQPFA